MAFGFLESKHNLKIIKFLKFSSAILIYQSVLLQLQCNAHVDKNPYRHHEVLDIKGKYILDWLVNWEENRIIFSVTVQTKGYVGFGLSHKGKMKGADIVIGGVLPNGKPYFTDRHGIAHQSPTVDEHQDYTLHSAWESDSHTFLSFSRAFETCDDHDVPIHDDLLAIIWAYGDKDDELEYHYKHVGIFPVYLLDPEIAPKLPPGLHPKDLHDMGDVKTFHMGVELVLPQHETTYVCTMHKAPHHMKKKHIIGFNTAFKTEIEHLHVHHFLLHRCHPPVGKHPKDLFEPFVGQHEEACYMVDFTLNKIPTEYCRELVHVWEVGGKPLFLPDHVGIPMSEFPDEYYLMEVHFDNVEHLPEINVNFALEVFYTGNLRPHDAGILSLGTVTPSSPAIIVPPQSAEHLIFGHCGSMCTKKMLPQNGINVFAYNLHTHVAGQSVRLLHIRDNHELPWIGHDDNYNFNYQQVRIMRKERNILPGDLLINRCNYGTMDRNRTVTIGGYAIRDEMCDAYIWYYNKIPIHSICRSDIRSVSYNKFVGVLNKTWSDERVEFIVTDPHEYAGMAVSQVGDYVIGWTVENRNQLQLFHRYVPQVTQCPPMIVHHEKHHSKPLPPPPPLQRFTGVHPHIGHGHYKTEVDMMMKEHDIYDSEFEFVSVYPKDIVPYEIPRMCKKPYEVDQLQYLRYLSEMQSLDQNHHNHHGHDFNHDNNHHGHIHDTNHHGHIHDPNHHGHIHDTNHHNLDHHHQHQPHLNLDHHNSYNHNLGHHSH